MNNLKAIKRENVSAGQINKLRNEGLIPAILYGGKSPNAKISVEKKSVKNILHSESFLSTVIELDIEGKKEKVLPRDIAYHVVSDEPIHIDFMRIVAGSRIVIEIPVQFKNQTDSPGLKRGGVLNIVRRKVELKCPAEKIPDDIIIDLAGLDIGSSIKISSVQLPKEVKPTIADRDFVIATIAAPTVVKEPEKPVEETTAEGVEGEPAAEGGEASATPAKEGEAPKKDEKGKEQSGDKKPSGDKKQPEKKQPEKK